LNYLSLFAGIGGIDLGLARAGFRCVGMVEIDPFCRAVLAKNFPGVPLFSDVRDFDARPFAGSVDLVAGGFPCQDISVAGKGAGIEGSRSGLWSHMHCVVRVLRPAWVLAENVPALRTRGADRVLGEGNGRQNGPTGCELGRAVTREWPSPVASEDKRGCKHPTHPDWHRARGAPMNLIEWVRYDGNPPSLWPTPQAADQQTSANWPHHGGNATLPVAVKHGVGPRVQGSRSTNGSRPGSLNSAWVAVLMGHPPDWCELPTDTLLELSATASSRKSLK
jgi:hypothetical protein